MASAAWPAPSDADAVVVPPPHLWPLPAPGLPSPPAPRTALYCLLPSHIFTCSCAVRPGGGGHPAAADVPRVLLARLQAQLQQAAGACANTSGIKHSAVQPMECACTECASLSSAVCTLQPTHHALACAPLPRPRCSPGRTKTSGRRLSASRWQCWSSCSSCRGRQVGGRHACAGQSRAGLQLLCCLAATSCLACAKHAALPAAAAVAAHLLMPSLLPQGLPCGSGRLMPCCPSFRQRTRTRWGGLQLLAGWHGAGQA